MELISFFKAAVIGGEPVDPVALNMKAATAGYLVDPAVCNNAVERFIDSQQVNYNTTFYKSFGEVAALSDVERVIHQLLHYMSTYGTNFTGPVFTMNPEPAAMAFKELTQIRGVTEDEFFEMCCQTLKSGIALKDSLRNSMFDFLVEYLYRPSKKEIRESFDIDSFKNRDIRIQLYYNLGRMPEDGVEKMRLLVYIASWHEFTSPINSKELYDDIVDNLRHNPMAIEELVIQMKDSGCESLAALFLRYKRIFMAIKIGLKYKEVKIRFDPNYKKNRQERMRTAQCIEEQNYRSFFPKGSEEMIDFIESYPFELSLGFNEGEQNREELKEFAQRVKEKEIEENNSRLLGSSGNSAETISTEINKESKLESDKESEINQRIEGIKLINKISRLSHKLHKPMRKNVLDSILSSSHSIEEVREAIHREKSQFRLIRMLMYVRSRLNLSGTATDEIYIIRNGKMFIRSDRELKEAIDYSHAREVEAMLKEELISRVRKKVAGKRVLFPEGLDLVAPTSERNFVGDVPLFTSYKLSKNNFIGVYWRDEWGTHDFDLSFCSFSGAEFGWHSNYKDGENKIIFSGDMTKAPYGATEMFHIEREVPDGVFYVNRYWGKVGSRLRLFFGQGTPVMGKTYGEFGGEEFSMDPMDVRLQADMVSEKREQMVGVVMDSRFYFCNLQTSESAISCARLYPLEKVFGHKIASVVNLRDLLLEAGAVEYKKGENAGEPDFDLRLTQGLRPTLIGLFS